MKLKLVIKVKWLENILKKKRNDQSKKENKRKKRKIEKR